ncbi:hypothetical protein Mapa_014464 [Marchantia paleacea]|nr:hypothetical protein Mapa_014464 [Marchantia paleacea]
MINCLQQKAIPIWTPGKGAFAPHEVKFDGLSAANSLDGFRVSFKLISGISSLVSELQKASRSENGKISVTVKWGDHHGHRFLITGSFGWPEYSSLDCDQSDFNGN